MLHQHIGTYYSRHNHGQPAIRHPAPRTPLLRVRLRGPAVRHLLITQYARRPQSQPGSLLAAAVLYRRILLPSTDIPARVALEVMQGPRHGSRQGDNGEVRVGVRVGESLHRE